MTTIGHRTTGEFNLAGQQEDEAPQQSTDGRKVLQHFEGELQTQGIASAEAFVALYGRPENLPALVSLQATYQELAPEHPAAGWIQAALDSIDTSSNAILNVMRGGAEVLAVTVEHGNRETGLDAQGPDGTLERFNTRMDTHLARLSSMVTEHLTRSTSAQTAIVDGSPSGAPDALASRWRDYIGQHRLEFGAVDVNAFVQAVLRDSYMENTKDLHFFAEKVKWFNEVKRQIRDELTRARDFMATIAGLEDDALLPHLFFGKVINTQYMGADSQIVMEGEKEFLDLKVGDSELLLAPEIYESPGIWNAIVALNNGFSLVPEDYNSRSCTNNVAGNVVNSFYYFMALHDLVEGHSDNYKPEDLVADLKDQYGIDAEYDRDGRLTVTMPDGSTFVDTSGNGGLGEADLNFSKALTDIAAAVGLDGHDLATSFDDFKESGFVDAMSAMMNDTGSQYPEDKMMEVFALAFMYADAGKATEEVGTGKPIGSKAQLDSYIKGMEEKLSSVGDDAQLANVDLQNMLQKQQQTIQMMSNISKMLHDTAQAVIRKIGG